MKLPEFTEEETMENIQGVEDLAAACFHLNKYESIPFNVEDALLMCGLINHLAIKAGYITNQETK